MNHSFEIAVAQNFDVETAIFLNNMVFWIQKNVANKHNYYDGTYWTYNTHNAYTKIFPYWTLKQIRRIIDNAVAFGLIVKGNYNKKEYDQTNWYSLTDKALTYYPLLAVQLLTPPAQTGTPPAQTGRPIPDSKPNLVDTSAQSAAVAASGLVLTPVECIQVYQQVLPDNPKPAVNKVTGSLAARDLKAIKKFKEYWLAIYHKPITVKQFRFYLQAMKEEYPEFTMGEYLNRQTGRLVKNGIRTLIHWETLDKFKNKEL